MIKLKPLLNEESAANYKSFTSELKSGKLTPSDITKHPAIYRGSKNRSISTVEKIVPRNDRVPRDSFVWINEILEGYRLKYYKNIPSRYELVFASTSSTDATYYGSGKYYLVFVPNTAKIYSNGTSDSVSYLNSMTLYAINILNYGSKAKVRLRNDNLNKCIKSYKDPDSNPKQFRYMGSYLDDFNDIIHSNAPSEQIMERYKYYVDKLKRELEYYFRYMEILNLDTLSNSYSDKMELMIKTPYYYLVNTDWFNHNINGDK